MTNNKSYLGVSGFTNPEQVKDAVSIFNKCNLQTRKLMIGVLVSRKTLNGGECNSRSPKPKDIDSIFTVADNNCLNMIHYYAPDSSGLGKELLGVAELSSLTDGIQINVAWPLPEEIEKFCKYWSRSYNRLILQVGPKALKEFWHDNNFNLTAFYKTLSLYKDLITDILIDPSGGTGTFFDIGFMKQLLLAANQVLPFVGKVMAGGLCAEKIVEIADIFKEYPYLSFDAEGKLHKDGILNKEYVTDYLQTSAKVLKMYA